MKEGLIAVDIGTSSCRAILFDQQLQQHAQANYVLAFDRPHPGWAEQHPEEVLEGVMACIQQVLQDADQNEYQVAGICFSAAVCSLLLLDERDEPLTPASIWADRRASNQAQQLLVEPGLELYHRTGCPIHASYLPAKLVWWHEMHPEVLSKAQRLVSLKSYVLAQLCGNNPHSVIEGGSGSKVRSPRRVTTYLWSRGWSSFKSWRWCGCTWAGGHDGWLERGSPYLSPETLARSHRSHLVLSIDR
jgi:gluconokinase